MEKMRNVLDHTPGDPFRRQLPGYGGPYLLAGIYQVSFKKNPSSWSEELVSYMFGWMALSGRPW